MCTHLSYNPCIKMGFPGGASGKESEIESCSVVSNTKTPWSIQSMEFSRPEYWSG